MNHAWVVSSYDMKPHSVAKQDKKKAKKLQVRVVMCCNTCVDKVEDTVSGMPGVAAYKTDRWKDRLTITESPHGGPDHYKLVRKLKKATHDRKVKILDSDDEEEEASSSPEETPTVIYHHKYYTPGLVPWAPSSSGPSPSFITNPAYFHHPVGCGMCMGQSGAVCANCGRGAPYP